MTKLNKKKPIIWTISGSDCSGGAGIAADIKTGHGLGVEVCHLITANTVQNSSKLISVNPVPIDILQHQFEVLIVDKPPSVIKIGLVANVEQVVWLRQLIINAKKTDSNLIVVYDPVGQASVGGSFSAITLEQLTPLLRQVDVITPNLMEAKSLARFDQVAQDAAVEKLAKKIYDDYSITSIIVKGGHSEKDNGLAIDYCYHQLNQLSEEKQDNQEKLHQVISYQLSSPRVNTHYSHGGGCSFATALSSFLAHGYLIRDAFTLAKAFVNQGLSASEQISELHCHQYYGAFEQQGWPREAQFFPKVVEQVSVQYHNLPAFNSLELNDKKLALYPVIDSLYWLKRLLPLGLEIIQLRVKNLAENELEQVIIEAVELAKDYGTRLFINDYWQLAIKHGAYGVHIGQEDLAEADLVAIQQSGIRLGISTHGCYEFLLAQQLQPSYLAIGAIFPTKTKDMTGQIQGLDNLRQVLALRPENEQQTPVVAIGGITLERAAKVVETGVESIAVVTAITEAEKSHGISPEQAVAKIQAIALQCHSA
ncbi:thiamine phosphate synthase [Colwellia psychrerythraea]|uniref:Thiamine-phosphate synthase n=1 Tax=Colwellia psychrerythraea TaxID=28229 RepID=A0A099L389_COLPS|nr:thiamine phosphate synthase [Colwellia psychrerythraea]KGJ97429.1 Thiamine-phosphate pyrophosphorylase [Colwellia psychrerythraea]